MLLAGVSLNHALHAETQEDEKVHVLQAPNTSKLNGDLVGLNHFFIGNRFDITMFFKHIAQEAARFFDPLFA